jgi:hypothetical protein
MVATATTRRGERGGTLNGWRKPDHHRERLGKKKKKKIVYLEACAHSARAICMACPISDAAYFTLTVKVLDYVRRLGIYVLICDASLGWKKVSGHHFVGGSIVHQNITELPLYNNDEPSKTSIQDKITTTACAPWFLTDDFDWKPLKNCRSIMQWNTVRYCMLYDGDSFLLLVWTNKKGNFLIEKEGLLYTTI